MTFLLEVAGTQFTNSRGTQALFHSSRLEMRWVRGEALSDQCEHTAVFGKGKVSGTARSVDRADGDHRELVVLSPSIERCASHGDGRRVGDIYGRIL